MKKIRLGDYIDLITDYHSGGSYEIMKKMTKILHEPSYAVMIRTINFENNNFNSDLVYCDKSSYDFLEYSHVRENDILMNKIANPGSVYIMPKVPYRATCGLNLFLIRLKDINQRYMYYMMKYREAYIKSKAHGTTTKTITKDEVRDLIFWIDEDTDRQDSIEKVLTNLEYKIDLNNRINTKLEQMAKRLYDYWFVQFDFPGADGKPYKSNGGKMVWNEKLKREIPYGWDVNSVFDNPISTLIKPGITKFERKEYLPTANVVGRTFFKGEYIEYESRENRANMQPTFYSIWFAKMKDSIKHLFINKEMKYFVDNVILSTGFCGLQTSEQAFEYVASFISSNYFENLKNTLSHGATQQAVNNEDLEKVPFIIPNQETLKNFHEKTKSLYSKLSQNIVENAKLVLIRDKLLPLLMNGQVVVE